MQEIKTGYTRVSQILSLLPSMIRRTEENYEIWGYPFQSIDQEVLKKKCIIGTNVHNAINAWSSNDFHPLNDCEKGYYESFLKWKQMISLRCFKSELRLYEEHMKITGAIDMLGQIKDNPECQLIDFKTSAQPDLLKWSLQAAFYHHILKHNKFEVSDTVLFVQLDKNGNSPKVHSFSVGERLKKMMISSFNVYKFLTEK